MALNPLTDQTLDTANERYFDLQLQHQVGLRRLSAGVARQTTKTISEADAALVVLLRARLARLSGGLPSFAGMRDKIETERYDRLRESIVALRTSAWDKIKRVGMSEMSELAAHESAFELRLLGEVTPMRIDFKTASAAEIRAAAVTRPFGGGFGASRTLAEWFASVSETDQRELISSIRQGIVQGKTIQQMVQEVAGTRVAGFTDGILAASRRNAETIVRTGINHVSNVARESIWDANSEVISALQWTSTLDGRTSAICRARDGRMSATKGNKLPTGAKKLLPAGARPPAHPNCRSVMIAIISGQGLSDIAGVRPFVRDTRTRAFQEKDFRVEAREADPQRWADSTRAQRNALVKIQRGEWVSKNVGTVPSSIDYDTWLRRQPRSFQDEVLGKAKAKKFREGLTLDKFVDRNGQELTLRQFKLLGL